MCTRMYVYVQTAQTGVHGRKKKGSTERPVSMEVLGHSSTKVAGNRSPPAEPGTVTATGAAQGTFWVATVPTLVPG